MTQSYAHDVMLSPFTWRYGSPAMRAIWSEANKRRLWRQVWVALARAQHHAGLVSAAQLEDVIAHADEVDIDASLAVEADIHHDLMAELLVFAGQCSVGGGILHLGATSMDIEDNAEVLRIREALDSTLTGLKELLSALADLIEREADLVCIGFTHLQAAAPTTVGYRLAGYAQDLLSAWETLRRLKAEVRGKGFKGAVGTAATFRELLAGTPVTPEQMEAEAMADLGLDAFLVTGQTYPRRQDWLVLNGLADVGLTAYRFAFDLRFLQSPPVGEWSEPFGAAQVGSSAMPFKRNPIHAENIDSLARYLSGLPHIAWENAATSLLERTLDDSANRRIILPQAFLATDEIIMRALRILKGLQLDRLAIKRNLAVFGTFAATERLLMEAARMGGNRQTLHEIIRAYSLDAWEALREGSSNPLIEMLSADERITRLVPPARVRELMRAEEFVGTAPARARRLAAQVRDALAAQA